MALFMKNDTCLKNLSEFVDADIVFLCSDTIEDFSDFGDALVFEGFKGDNFGRSSEVFMVSIMVFNTLSTERFDTCHGGTEVYERLAIVFNA
jgi:hypothetical protein